jgi:hypothetical protein
MPAEISIIASKIASRIHKYRSNQIADTLFEMIYAGEVNRLVHAVLGKPIRGIVAEASLVIWLSACDSNARSPGDP